MQEDHNVLYYLDVNEKITATVRDRQVFVQITKKP